jgi:hypothetical protein
MQFRCPRCKTYFTLRAMRPNAESPDGQPRGNTGLTGAIPEDLFSGISGAPASSMFGYTFNGCTGLTGIGAKLIPTITQAQLTATPNCINSMFHSCTGLTGNAATMKNGSYLHSLTLPSDQNVYTNCTGLTQYSSMAANWK